jgi:hypothetical protein
MVHVDAEASKVNQSEGGNTERPKRRITLQGVKAHKKIV